MVFIGLKAAARANKYGDWQFSAACVLTGGHCIFCLRKLCLMNAVWLFWPWRYRFNTLFSCQIEDDVSDPRQVARVLTCLLKLHLLAPPYECVCTVRRPIKACDQVQVSAGCRRQARRRSALCPHRGGWMARSGTVCVLWVNQLGQLSFPSITSAVMIWPLEKRAVCPPC